MNQETDHGPETQEPHIIHLGEEFYPFRLPMKEWHGYSYHVSWYPSMASRVVLSDGFIPNLTMVTIANPFGPNRRKGSMRAEVDKNQLGKLGLLQRPPNHILPGYPLALGASQWTGSYIFDLIVLEQMQHMEFRIILPEGEYKSSPAVSHVRDGDHEIPYATGVNFELFKNLKQPKRSPRPLSIDMKKAEYLESIRAKFIVNN